MFQRRSLKLMQEEKKHVSMLRQLITLFAVGVVLISLMTSATLLFASKSNVERNFISDAQSASSEVASYINQFPAHDWLLNYWCGNCTTMDIEYDAVFDSDSDTAEKCRRLAERHPGLQLEYAGTSEIEALPPEDQALYAEIVYSWLITQLNEVAVNHEMDYLFGIVTQEPYDDNTILFIASKDELARGDGPGELYPVGSSIPVTQERKSAMSSAARGTPATTANEDGYFKDYFYPVASYDGHDVLIGATRNFRVLRNDIRSLTLTLTILSSLFLIILATACLIMVQELTLVPLRTIRDNIRIYKLTKESAGVAANLSKLDSRNEIGDLSEDIIDLTRAMDKYTQDIAAISSEKERINTELSLANRIQMAMMPHEFPAFPDRKDFDLYATIKPAREVGGDFYDFTLLDDDHLALFIADVSGKGVPAALYVMATKLILSFYFKSGKSPAEILTESNRDIVANNPDQMFITVWLGILDLKTGVLTAANAGHDYPIIKNRAGGRYTLLRDDHGFVIGSLTDVEYEEYEIKLEPGSGIFLYTDGLPEATASDKSMFGTSRVVAELNRHPDASPEEQVKKMNEAVSGFVNGAEQFDDLTMLSLIYYGTV